MESKSSVTVNFANHSYIFMKFQEQYKNLCQTISENKKMDIGQSIKRLRSFVFEYLPFNKSKEMRDKFTLSLNNLSHDFDEDTEYLKLSRQSDKSPDKQITYNQKYYYYLIRLFKIIGAFGDELSKTFMPNKSDREKHFRYSNNNSFFEQFTYYKSLTSEKLAEFSLRKFNTSFAYFLGFYFAYYLFVDEKSRHLCENVFSNILNLVLNREIINLILMPINELSSEKLNQTRELDYILHDGLNHIFFRCNYSYSEYGIMPKIEEKLEVDTTAI